MKLKVFVAQDFHADFWESSFKINNKEEVFKRLKFNEKEEYDLIILAGDIMEATAKNHGAYVCILRHFCNYNKNVPVVLVKGNHENYRTSLVNSKYFLKTLQTEFFSNLHFLENEYVDLNIKGEMIRVFGATLWTDFNKQNPIAMLDANTKMNDFNQMILKPAFRKFTAEDAFNEHQITLDKLYSAGQQLPKDYKFIVVTHHSPLFEACLSFKEKRNWGNSIEMLDYSYASDLTKYITELKNKPSYWIFGHIHAPFESEFEGIKFISNPYGYPTKYEKRLYENPTREFEL